VQITLLSKEDPTQLKEYYTPCSPGDPKGQAMSWLDVPGGMADGTRRERRGLFFVSCIFVLGVSFLLSFLRISFFVFVFRFRFCYFIFCLLLFLLLFLLVFSLSSQLLLFLFSRADQMMEPMITLLHFKRAIRTTRPTVCDDDIKQHIEWTQEFGQEA
jgi:hypothetical protein